MLDNTKLANWLLSESFEAFLSESEEFQPGTLTFTLPKLISNEIRKAFNECKKDPKKLNDMRKAVAEGIEYIGISDKTIDDISKLNPDKLSECVIEESKINYEKYFDYTETSKIVKISDFRKFADIAENLLLVVYEYMDYKPYPILNKFVKNIQEYFEPGTAYGNDEFKVEDFLKLLKSNSAYGEYK